MKSMNSVLVCTHGFFGDIAFGSSLAKELKEEYDTVDYIIGFPQMKSLLYNNPYIDNVFVTVPSGPVTRPEQLDYNYDRVIRLEPLSFEIPPVTEYKQKNNFKNTDPSYKLYTDSFYDKEVEKLFKTLPKDKKVIGVMSNWEERSFRFTEEQYVIGKDVPTLGYGGRHRNTDSIVQELSEHYTILELGLKDKSQLETIDIIDGNNKSILFECSVMKYCDAFVGAEGGLCNLAAGVGTKTIITGDFIHQLYGWNGVLKKIKEPKLGPKYYFNNNKHITLDPYLTDKEVVEQIKQLV